MKRRLGKHVGVAGSAILTTLLCSPLAAENRPDTGCGGQHLRVEAMHWTGMRVEGSWFLTVEESGAAVVKTGDEKHEFQVSHNQCVALAQLVDHERFFDLEGGYGIGVIDGPIRHLKVSLGKRRHSVELRDDAVAEEDRDAVGRALRVWIAVRSLFDVPGLADSREEDRAFLEEE